MQNTHLAEELKTGKSVEPEPEEANVLDTPSQVGDSSNQLQGSVAVAAASSQLQDSAAAAAIEQVKLLQEEFRASQVR